MKRIDRIRRNLEMQGYTGLEDATLAAIDPWLRVPPAFCMSAVLAGTLTGWTWLFFAMLPLAFAGVVLPNHPFDAIYNYGFRRLNNGPWIPKTGAPRRFACALATVWMLATGLAFHADALVLARILGVMFVAVSGILVVTGFCIPSWTFGRIRRVLARGDRFSGVTTP